MCKVAGENDAGSVWRALRPYLRCEDEETASRFLRRLPIGYYVHPWSLMNASEAYARSGRHQVAAAFAQLAIDGCTARDDHENRLRAEGQLGRVYEHAGRIDDAMRGWQAAFWEGTSNRLVANRLTLHLLRQGRDEECIRVVDEASKRIRDRRVLAVLAKRRDRALRRLAGRERKPPRAAG